MFQAEFQKEFPMLSLCLVYFSKSLTSSSERLADVRKDETVKSVNCPMNFRVVNHHMGLQGAYYSGYLINQLDIAPNFAGTIYGITSGCSSLGSWLAPLTVATLTEGNVI